MDLTRLTNSELQTRIERCIEHCATCNELAECYHGLADRQPEFEGKARRYKELAYDETTLLAELEAEQARRTHI